MGTIQGGEEFPRVSFELLDEEYRQLAILAGWHQVGTRRQQSVELMAQTIIRDYLIRELIKQRRRDRGERL